MTTNSNGRRRPEEPAARNVADDQAQTDARAGNRDDATPAQIRKTAESRPDYRREYEIHRADADRLIAVHNAALIRFWEQIDKYHRVVAECNLTAERFDAKRARLRQASTTAAAKAGADSALDRITEQLDRYDEPPVLAEPVVTDQDQREAGR